MSNPIALIAHTIVTFITIYTYLIIIRVLLSWFPTINWLAPPFSILSQLTDPYLKVFRSIIPPIGGAIDISPILAILLLEIARAFFARFLY